MRTFVSPFLLDTRETIVRCHFPLSRIGKFKKKIKPVTPHFSEHAENLNDPVLLMEEEKLLPVGKTVWLLFV